MRWAGDRRYHPWVCAALEGSSSRSKGLSLNLLVKVCQSRGLQLFSLYNSCTAISGGGPLGVHACQFEAQHCSRCGRQCLFKWALTIDNQTSPFLLFFNNILKGKIYGKNQAGWSEKWRQGYHLPPTLHVNIRIFGDFLLWKIVNKNMAMKSIMTSQGPQERKRNNGMKNICTRPASARKISSPMQLSSCLFLCRSAQC